MVLFSSVVHQKRMKFYRHVEVSGCRVWGVNQILFCLTRWETLKRLALEGSVNCVAYSPVTSSNADATETARVETSLKSLIFLETFLAPTFPEQLSWLWFPRIEISCSPLVIAELRQLSV